MMQLIPQWTVTVDLPPMKEMREFEFRISEGDIDAFFKIMRRNRCVSFTARREEDVAVPLPS